MTTVVTHMLESHHLRWSADPSASMATARRVQAAQKDMSMSALTSAIQVHAPPRVVNCSIDTRPVLCVTTRIQLNSQKT